MPQRLYFQCPRCAQMFYAISAERLKRINEMGDDDSRYRQCRCGQSASVFTPVAANALPRAATVTPLCGAPVDAVELAALEAAEDADENIDEQGFPVLPAAPKEADGKHWGMKHAIGWSNAYACPDAAILWHALAQINRAAIQEAIGYYGLDRVLAFWTRMKEVRMILQKPTIYTIKNGELFEAGVRRTDEILAQLRANNG